MPFSKRLFMIVLLAPALLGSLAVLAQTGGGGAGRAGASTVGAGTGGASAEDLALVRDQRFSSPEEFAHYHGPSNNEKVMQNKHRNFIAQYNPVSLVLKGALLGYQKILSQQLARNCPYEISCSNFSKQSIREFGVLKGVFISADRILRCNRIGYEDVSPLSINPVTGRIIDSPGMYRAELPGKGRIESGGMDSIGSVGRDRVDPAGKDSSDLPGEGRMGSARVQDIDPPKKPR